MASRVEVAKGGSDGRWDGGGEEFLLLAEGEGGSFRKFLVLSLDGGGMFW